ncbi:MAG: DUF721 domain-containing protein [Bacteroidales bacterium]|jgi:predicted nucleic acid-binding Zn ribbon protein|nr:DUF721 domain-containing protein [Bacteroidales bacterium]
MKRQKVSSIGDLLSDFVKDRHLESGLLQVKIFNAWDRTVGPEGSRHTTSKFYKNKILFCTINSSMIRNQLYYQKENIADAINGELGAEYVKKIILK